VATSVATFNFVCCFTDFSQLSPLFPTPSNELGQEFGNQEQALIHLKA